MGEALASHQSVREKEDGVQNPQEQSGLLFIFKQVIVWPPLGAITVTREQQPRV